MSSTVNTPPDSVMLRETLRHATHLLSSCVELPNLEAEILLAFTLQQTRAYLHTWPEYILSKKQQKTFMKLVMKRIEGIPIAYLTGTKEFWSLTLSVNEHTLIPRPETELVVEQILTDESLQHSTQCIADLGTGSGAIALAIAKHRPDWEIYATDIDENALAIAKLNAQTNGIHNVQFYLGAWCDALPMKKFSLIVSNPPYIDPSDKYLCEGDLRYEPKHALIAPEEGYAYLFLIAEQARNHLKNRGQIVLEHGASQAEKLCERLAKLGYETIKTRCDLNHLPRVTHATFNI